MLGEREVLRSTYARGKDAARRTGVASVTWSVRADVLLRENIRRVGGFTTFF